MRSLTTFIGTALTIATALFIIEHSASLSNADGLITFILCVTCIASWCAVIGSTD